MSQNNEEICRWCPGTKMVRQKFPKEKRATEYWVCPSCRAIKPIKTRLDKILGLVKTEFERATAKFSAFNNAHEGYAVLLEEVDELWDSVKLKQSDPDRKYKIFSEARQVAAMAVRIIYDCFDFLKRLGC